jgi:putative hydrolase of the HAD superfamily
MLAALADIKGIYFDLDDTLCGYWDAAKAGLRRTFTDHLQHGRTPEEMVMIWGEEFSEFVKEIGSPYWYSRYCESGEHTRLELMTRVLGRVGVHDQRLAEALSSTYYVERHAKLDLFPEALEVLEALARSFPLGLITNGPADIQRQEIEKLQIGSFFTHVFIEGEMRQGKPHPEVMLRAQEAMECQPSQILMVGNSFKHDIVPSQESGWRTAWVRRPSDVPPSSKTGRPEEKPEGSTAPDLEMANLKELLPVLIPEPAQVP